MLSGTTRLISFLKNYGVGRHSPVGTGDPARGTGLLFEEAAADELGKAARAAGRIISCHDLELGVRLRCMNSDSGQR